MSHYCKFCQMEHTSSACYHPGNQQLQELRQQLAAITQERDKHAEALVAIAVAGVTKIYKAQAQRYRERNSKLVGHMKWCIKVEGLNENLREALDEIDDYEADHPPPSEEERPATPIQIIVRKALAFKEPLSPDQEDNRPPEDK